MSQLYQRSPNMVSRNIAGEMILVPIRNNVGDLQCIYSLNEVGAFIWEHIDGKSTVAELVSVVRGEFDASPEQVESDVQQFLAQLESVGAVSALEAGRP